MVIKVSKKLYSTVDKFTEESFAFQTVQGRINEKIDQRWEGDRGERPLKDPFAIQIF